MANSLSDQLLKAGLITQEQIQQADQEKEKQKEQAKARKKARQQTKKAKPGKQTHPISSQKQATRQGKKEASDLAQFYNQRNEAERAEREAEEQRKREAAERRRKTRKQIRKLISENACNDPEANIRFNFVIGETVKYLYVTDKQQQAISNGELAITFMDGKRCLVPTPVGEEIKTLDPEKIVISFNADSEDTPDTGNTPSVSSD